MVQASTAQGHAVNELSRGFPVLSCRCEYGLSAAVFPVRDSVDGVACCRRAQVHDSRSRAGPPHSGARHSYSFLFEGLARARLAVFERIIDPFVGSFARPYQKGVSPSEYLAHALRSVSKYLRKLALARLMCSERLCGCVHPLIRKVTWNFLRSVLVGRLPFLDT